MRSPSGNTKATSAKIVSIAFFAAAATMTGWTQAPKTEAAASTQCFAIANPTMEGMPGNAAEVASAIRDLMSSYLQGPSTKVVTLETKLVSQAAEEAKAKGCEPILVLKVTRKAGGHALVNALGRSASYASWRVPGGSSTAGSMARAGAAGGIDALGSAAQSVHAKDEVSLEYTLQSGSGAVEFGPKTEHQKAKADGEDLLTPAIAKAAEELVRLLKTKP